MLIVSKTSWIIAKDLVIEFAISLHFHNTRYLSSSQQGSSPKEKSGTRTLGKTHRSLSNTRFLFYNTIIVTV